MHARDDLVDHGRDLGLVEVLRADRILVEESALTSINERYG